MALSTKREDAYDSDLASFFGDLSQSEKLSQIKPPLVMCQFPWARKILGKFLRWLLNFPTFCHWWHLILLDVIVPFVDKPGVNYFWLYVKSKVKISQNFVAFSEYMNFSFSFQSLISTVPPIVIIGEKLRHNTSDLQHMFVIRYRLFIFVVKN